MRSLRLARIAAEAEQLRLRRIARRFVIRACLVLAAFFFVGAAFAVAHIAAWLALNPHVGPIYSALILAGVDLLIAVILGALAMRNAPDRIEREALAVRNTAASQVVKSMSLLILLRPILRRLGGRGTWGGVAAAVTEGFLRR